MTIARVYISTHDLRAGNTILEGDEHHHLSRVLRMHPGQEVQVLDGKGLVGKAAIREITSARTSIAIEETLQVDEERPRLHLMQALPQGTKMDDVVNYAVELGAAFVTPFACMRSRKLDEAVLKRLERWRKIALESARISGRPYLCEVMAPVVWDRVLEMLREVDLALFADEAGGARPSLALGDEDAEDIALLIGPEGGFEDSDREDMESIGAHAVTLGRNILRTETAGMVLLAAVKCHLGKL